MYNELIWIFSALVYFTLLTLIYRIFGRSGLFVWIGMSTVVANIQVLKMVELFGITATLGNILYGTIFLATDIINEQHGKKEARKAVWLGFFTLLSMTLIMQIALLYTPADSDVAHDSLETIFDLVPQVAIGSLLAYIVSQSLSVHIFHWFKVKTAGRFLWLRNTLSTMISQLIDSTIFCVIAFWGVLTTDLAVWIQIYLSTYFIKFIVAALDTPFIYLARSIGRKEKFFMK